MLSISCWKPSPILQYYNLTEKVTIQCDGSQTELGGGQLVAYASRTLTDTQIRYAQIKKELLAIVFACDRFYGRDIVSVELDHQPLEAMYR